MPTIVICGTPGTGKSTLINEIKTRLTDAKVINLSQFAVENKCTNGYDDKLDSHIIDDDKLEELLLPVLENSNLLNVIESIHSDHLDPDIVDKVFVCRADTKQLYDRLKARGYKEEKITNNVEAEIFQLIYDEAVEVFDHDKVVELKNNVTADIGVNSHIVCQALSDISKSLINDKDPTR